ncbi:Uncharacterized protein SCF082_LOCUS46446 [Durusdinium trenchii]|uniref:Selenoprotein O n=1 Tax=Durusdinium trenchii TaxID=1381693 RepID=A0ABP0RHG1_9DINO
MAFHGDGRYPGDGGAALEELWQLLSWREIRNCPGRYTTSDLEARFVEPSRLLERLSLASPGVPLTLELAHKDPIVMHRLPGGGGLLSYCKANATFVHTLNTESGLIRKVDALGVGNWGRLLESEPATYAAEACRACVAVLPFLLDSEKNAAASALVQVLRRTARARKAR